MRLKEGGRAATAEHPAIPKVAPRFTRAAQAERSRLEGKREQLRHKREAVQAELGQIDRADAEIGGLLELLAPLLAAKGSEVGAAGGDSTTAAERGKSRPERGAADERGRALPPHQRQPAKE
jgi:hypothetical protein